MNTHETVQFLVVDDDEVSVMKVKRAIRKAKLANPVRVATDGVEALEVLRGDATQAKISPPFVVTLDINMPRMDGHEFLREIREDHALHRVVVFVLTTSQNEADVRSAYDRNVAGYILKENSEEDLIAKISMIDTFANLVVLPS